MANTPEFSPDDLLCRTCDRRVEKNKDGEMVHSSKGKKDHEVTKTIKYADWKANLVKLRTPAGQKPAEAAKKGGKKGTKKKPAEVNEDGKKLSQYGTVLGRKAKDEKEVKPKSLQRRTQRAALRRMTYEERTAREAELKKQKEARENTVEETLPDEYYHPNKGWHFPKVSSMDPVVNPTTREIIVPKTGQVMGIWKKAIPAKDSSEAKINSGQDHIDNHPEHSWQTAKWNGHPLVGYGPDTASDKNNRYSSFRTDMLHWAHDHKEEFDQGDNYEYALVQQQVSAIARVKKALISLADVQAHNNTWVVKRRQKYCTDCAPTILDTRTGKMARNPYKTVTRPEPEDLLPSRPNASTPGGVVSELTKKGTRRKAKTGLETIRSYRTRMGLLPTRSKPGPKPESIAPRAPRTATFEQGAGEGKPAGAP